jgi:hypothetical protein
LGDRLVPVYSIRSLKGDIAAVVSSGRLPTASNEVALGPAVLRREHVRLGSIVTLENQQGESRELTIVGTALSPFLTSQTDGALVMEETLQQLIPDNFANLAVRYASGVNSQTERAALDQRYPWAVIDESDPLPSPAVANLLTVRDVPSALAGFFALFRVLTLAHGLVLTVGRRQFDLAIIRGLGFTELQTRSAIAVAASAAGLLSLAIGVPLGLLFGRAIWGAAAGGLDLAPDLRWPTLALALALAISLTTANLVAWAAGRRVVTVRLAQLLHGE